jgi:hypothetical protein
VFFTGKRNTMTANHILDAFRPQRRWRLLIEFRFDIQHRDPSRLRLVSIEKSTNTVAEFVTR